MQDEEKSAVPGDLKDAIAENLRNYMRREQYDPNDRDDIRRLARTAGVSAKTLERLLRRETYPDNQPALKSLASLAVALRVETHHLVYKPRVEGEYKGPKVSVGKLQDSSAQKKFDMYPLTASKYKRMIRS